MDMERTSVGRVNIAFIALIVAVATIGGFMFGYDSGVINGTQEGLEKAFSLSKLGHRAQCRRDPARLRGGRFHRRPAGGHDRAARGDDDRRAAVHRQRAGGGRGRIVGDLHPRPHRRRAGRRRGERARAGLYQRSDTGEHPRPAVERPADHDHHRADRCVRRQLRSRAQRGRVARQFLVRLSGVALDVLDAGDPGRHLSSSRCC